MEKGSSRARLHIWWSFSRPENQGLAVLGQLPPAHLPFLHASDPPRSLRSLRPLPLETPRLGQARPGFSSPDIQALLLPVNAIEMPIAGPRSSNTVHKPDAVPACVPDHPPGTRS